MRPRALFGLAIVVVGCGGQSPPAPAPAPTAAAAAAAEAPSVERRPFVTAIAGRSQRIQWQVPQRDGQLTTAELTALAPRIARFRASPDSFTVDVSAALPLAQLLRVYAEDASGAVLGELRHYRFSLYDGLSIDSLGQVHGSSPGRGLFLVSVSERVAGDFRTIGPVHVRVGIVDSSGRMPPAPVVPRGSAVIYGRITDSVGTPIARATARVLVLVEGQPRSAGVTESDIDGQFRLEDLPSGEVRLIVNASGREPRVTTLQLSDGTAARHDASLGAPRPRTPPPGGGAATRDPSVP